MKRILFVCDSYRRQTGYATVGMNIIEQLLKLDSTKEKFVIGQLGIGDVPINSTPPFEYYTIIKDHSKCCGRGNIIEHYNQTTKTVEYIEPGLFLNLHANQAHCPRGENIPSDAYAQESCFFVINHFKPDIVVAINDIWGFYNINYLKNRGHFKFVPYLAVDSECFPPMIDAQHPGLPPINTIQCIGASNKVVVFTEFAKSEINKTCKIVTNGQEFTNLEVIPHGVNQSLFKPLPNRTALREQYFSVKDDTFILGCVARNQPRKRLDAIFQVLAILKKKYVQKNKRLICHFHCAIEDKMGNNLLWLAKYYDVVEMCVFDNRLRPGFGVHPQMLNEIFNCYDAHVLLTNSEGWGLPIIETMAAGIPNVISDYSAHADWSKDAAIKIRIAARVHEVKTDHIKGIVDISHAAKEISLLYQSDKMCKEYSKRSLALATELNWDNIGPSWVKLFEELDVSDLKDNRYNIMKVDMNSVGAIPEDPINTPFKLLEL